LSTFGDEAFGIIDWYKLGIIGNDHDDMPSNADALNLRTTISRITRIGTRLLVLGMMPRINTRTRQTTLMIISPMIYP